MVHTNKHIHKKNKNLSKKRIKRRTGARAQSKQIDALSTAVSRINKEQLENIRTSWQRPSAPIGELATYAPYICPIPYMMCDPLGTSPVAGARFWSDTLYGATTTPFSKRMVFGYSEAAANSNKIYHTGTRIRYQIYTNEPSYTKLGMFLLKPKKKIADQITLDRKLKASSVLKPYPGGLCWVQNDIDYTAHDGGGGTGVNTLFGAEINRKYWDVLYKREISLSHPLAAGFTTQVHSANTDPANNAMVASGTINVPGGGIIKNVSQLTQTTGNKSAPAFEAQYLDQTNEDSCYLVIIHNDVTLDAQAIDMGFVVDDFYKAVV